MSKSHCTSLKRGIPSSNIIRPGYQTLHIMLAQLSERLKTSAYTLNRKRLTTNERLHWQTRGRQHLLRSVAHHLYELGARHSTSHDLFLALQDYLRYFEKYEVDAQEEQRPPTTTYCWAVSRWKAEGVAQELPTLFADISHLLYIARSFAEHDVFTTQP